jgi:hypothetical protein
MPNPSRMKNIFLAAFCLLAGHMTWAQEKDIPTRSFVIAGEVKSPVTINIDDLKKWRAAPIGNVVITNHLGEKKSEAKELKGVLLKDVLGSVEINAETPRVLSEYYFVCKANDGYTVVYSWNELFNTMTGDSAYIVTEKEGQPASAMKESILMISPGDFKTGRRHVKALASIEVRRAR